MMVEAAINNGVARSIKTGDTCKDTASSARKAGLADKGCECKVAQGLLRLAVTR